MKKFLTIILMMLLCIFVSSCESKEEPEVGIGNPFTEVKTIEEAEKLAGFSINLPKETFVDNPDIQIRVIKDELIEVSYHGSEKWIVIRKGLDKGEEDISGDYNEYPEQITNFVNGRDFIFRGQDGKINVVTWKEGDYMYSVNINPGGIGIDYDVVIQILSQIK